jgi:hypothetical protein
MIWMKEGVFLEQSLASSRLNRRTKQVYHKIGQTSKMLHCMLQPSISCIIGLFAYTWTQFDLVVEYII